MIEGNLHFLACCPFLGTFDDSVKKKKSYNSGLSQLSPIENLAVTFNET